MGGSNKYLYPRSYRDAVNSAKDSKPRTDGKEFPHNTEAESYESWQVRMTKERVMGAVNNLKFAELLYIFRDPMHKTIVKAMFESAGQELVLCVDTHAYQRAVEVLISVARVLARKMSQTWVIDTVWDAPAEELLKELKLAALTALHMCTVDIFVTYELSIITVGAWSLYPA